MLITRNNFQFQWSENPIGDVIIEFLDYEIDTILYDKTNFNSDWYHKFIENIPVIETGGILCNQDITMSLNIMTMSNNIQWGYGNKTFFIGNNFNRKIFNSTVFDSNMKFYNINLLPFYDKNQNGFITVKQVTMI